jgi:hypothetical protein
MPLKRCRAVLVQVNADRPKVVCARVLLFNKVRLLGVKELRFPLMAPPQMIW